MEKVTIIVHTFKRPHQFVNLMNSIHKFYPEAKVISYDDSDNDFGLSYGRNLLVKRVQTPYFLLLDDDFIFTENTKIEKMIEKIEEGYDIVGGSLIQDGQKIHYEGRYKIENKELSYIQSTEEPLDFVFNFFLGRTEKIKEYGWDNELKLAEHTAFFLTHKGKLKIAYLEDVEIEHHPYKVGEYADYRSRAWKFMDIFMKKYGLKKITTFSGHVYNLGDYKLNEKEYEREKAKLRKDNRVIGV